MNAIRYWLISLFVATGLTGMFGIYVACVGAPDSFEFEALFFVGVPFFALSFAAVNVLHRPRHRPAGIAIYIVLLLLWIGYLLIIPESHWIEERKMQQALQLVVQTLLPGAIALFFLRQPWGKWSAILAVVISIVAAAMMFPNACMDDTRPVLVGGIWEVTWSQQLSESGSRLMLFALLAAMLLINVGRRDWRLFRWIGIAAAIAGYVYGLRNIYVPDSKPPGREACTGAVLNISAATLGIINIIMTTRGAGWVKVCKWTAGTVMAVAGAASATKVVAEYRLLHELDGFTAKDITQLSRIFGAAVALGLPLMLCQALARAMQRRPTRPTPPGLLEVKMTCPNCQREGVITLPGGRCAQCRLEFRIAVNEPVCAKCRHVLMNLVGDHCPECGSPIVSM